VIPTQWASNSWVTLAVGSSPLPAGYSPPMIAGKLPGVAVLVAKAAS